MSSILGHVSTNLSMDTVSQSSDWMDRDLSPVLRALKECSISRNLQRGKLIHGVSIKNGDINNVYVANTLLNMYAKCGSLTEARKIFDELQHRNIVSWNALMFGYADNGEGHLALDLFNRMLQEKCAPNATTYVAALKGCIDVASKEDGKMVARRMGEIIHSESVRNGCELHTPVASSLVNLYAKCGSMLEARHIFDRMQHHDVVSWTTLMLGYADNGQGEAALEMFLCMLREGYVLDSQAYVAALRSCTDLAEKEEPRWINKKLLKLKTQEKGMIIHSHAVRVEGCEYVGSTLIDMYAKCGSIEDAHNYFERMHHPSVVSWTALIMGYADNGKGETALELLTSMKHHGCAPNSRTFTAALKACIDLATKEVGKHVNDQKVVKFSAQERGMAVHFEATTKRCVENEMYFANMLIDMYAKCGSMVDARKAFDTMQHRSVVTWTTLILGYADNGEGNTSLELFSAMQREGCAPNSLTYAAVFKSCCTVGALEFGRAVHAEVGSKCMLDDAVLVSLVDFYGKCGSVVEAQQVFDSVPTRNPACWNALLGGYGRVGDTQSVFKLFQKMQDDNVQPNGVTLLCLLTACARSGLVDEGRNLFETMVSKYGIHPHIEHYTCMVDLLGQANELEDAVKLLKSMPCTPDRVVWKRVLDACFKWKNEEVGRYVFESLMDLDNKDAGGYVLMTNIYRSTLPTR